MDMESEYPKRLYKSRHDKMIDGVCGGVAEYIDVDPTVLRILWVLSIFLGGSGIIAYIVCMFVIPANPDRQPAAAPTGSYTGPASQHRFWGILLMAIGVIFLMTNLGAFAFLHLWHLSWAFFFSLMLIGAGLYLILFKDSGTEQPVAQTQTGRESGTAFKPHRLEKSRNDRKIFGVCGGLGKYFDLDPSFVRILYVIFTLVTHGFAILVYIALALLLPDETPQQA